MAALLSVQDAVGQPWIKGKKLTAFSNAEEESAGMTSLLPFLLETKLIDKGGIYTKGANYLKHVETTANIVTGQNPASAEEAAKMTLRMIRPTYNVVRK